MKFRAFWDVAPCSLIGEDRRFRVAYCLHNQGDDRCKLEAPPNCPFLIEGWRSMSGAQSTSTKVLQYGSDLNV
jgi:hypothetical protein